MKVVDSDKLRTWISQNEFESTTPTPPEPPVPPIPPPLPPPTPIPSDAEVLTWNATELTSRVIDPGQVRNYAFPVTGNFTNMRITVYPVAQLTDILCRYIFPDGREYKAQIHLPMSAKFYFVSQGNPYSIYTPNIPDLYMPQGTYILQVIAYASSSFQIKRTLQP